MTWEPRNKTDDDDDDDEDDRSLDSRRDDNDGKHLILQSLLYSVVDDNPFALYRLLRLNPSNICCWCSTVLAQ